MMHDVLPNLHNKERNCLHAYKGEGRGEYLKVSPGGTIQKKKKEKKKRG
jgi:hypothetical protein